MYDPNLSFYGHPQLPAGYDSTSIDGDDMNGSGVNQPIWPVVFDSYEGLKPVIVTQEMQDVFEKSCPDLVVSCPSNAITISHQDSTVTIKELP